MACNNSEYFVGNGPLYIRRVGGDCAGPTEGFWPVGDAGEFSISNDQSFNDHYESQTGARTRAARWLESTSVEFSLQVFDFKLETLAALLQGTQSAAVAAGSVAAEAITDAYEDQVFYVAFPGISAVTILDGATPLVEGTDFELIDSGRDGGIKIISGAPNFSAGNQLDVDYTHVGIEGSVSALTSGVEDYEIRFNGINLNNQNKPVIVNVKRAQFSAAENISLIGTDITELTFTGAVLPDANGDFYEIVKSNDVV